MMPNEARFPAVRLADLVDALEFVSVSELDENRAWLCRTTGRILFVSDSFDPEEDLPEDLEAAGYLAIPHRRDLDLGKPLAISFVDAELPEHAAQARDFFRRKGAYGRFKHLLQSAGILAKWYDYEERATRDAMRRWCEEAGVQIVEEEPMAESLAAPSAPGIGELQCQACHARAPAWEMVHADTMGAGYRDLCSRCWNEEIAGALGLDFEHVRFEPSDMSDGAGKGHRFYFLLRHLGDRLCLEAFELDQGEPAGYRFQVVGAADIDPLDLMGRLVERMRDALARHYLVEGELGLGFAGTEVRGRIDCDPDSDVRTPMLVIDGREVNWDDFGRMLMTFEGWRFKLTIEDPGDEIR